MWTIYCQPPLYAVRFTCPKQSRNSNSIVTGCTCISRYRNIEDVPTVHQRGPEGAQRLMPIALLQAFLNRCKATWLLREESAVGE